MKRRHQWPLAKVVRACPSAASVWLAMLDLAGERGSALITPTRKQLAALSGIGKLATVSRALTTLERAGWIVREHIPVKDGGVRSATLLRIVLRRSAPLRASTAHITVAPLKRPKGSAPLRVRDFSLRKRARVDAARPLPAGGCAPEEEDAGPVVKITDLLKRDAAGGKGGTP